MKRLTPLYLLIFAAGLAQAADNDALNGKWQVHSSIAGNESDQSCTFTQKDDDLTGSCSSDRGTVNIAGKVNGKKVSWSFKSEYEGTPLTVKYEGVLDSAKITGSMSVPEFAVEGEFTATQSK